MRKWILVSFFTALCLAAAAQQALNNDAIIKLAKAGLSDDLIVTTINSQAGAYDTSADGLIALKSAGVSDKVVAAIVARASAPAAPPAAATPAAAPAVSARPPGIDDVGVYYQDKSGAWQRLEPEIVNFKSGGVLKSLATNGLVKGDINGHINGEHSPTGLKTPIEILIYTPEGTAATEYQLLRLHAQKDSRDCILRAALPAMRFHSRTRRSPRAPTRSSFPMTLGPASMAFCRPAAVTPPEAPAASASSTRSRSSNKIANYRPLRCV